ncbi:hypothetical protein CO115_04300 [Candidatus Falkowbacteria bacterium CG_4_9_14_3_um_filter_36_9]|uniref:DUF5666 domain-containing protein n=1 Tax=Candidatus Falkowbacteria bacterium CG1_02_37_44 TaxID=1805146 RepID=A0A1J4T5N6_9BACT|nr:MAG: hypothetical protein AUJ27_02510 [Candidatus Falkowbacteria bacterium CG1_02_37_44]PJA10919.1 MAG: hypothetical protein COX67_02510 [Candidatus Falkowbacteria bacterium CG_4_10_14_0_2_um_filter_36_22]PJB18544.1 MAG: hypothetical protein CO115_04300 [Candidatus Falkowbacteria bacterium CG_4_9_14_3_um_filter_36_9]
MNLLKFFQSKEPKIFKIFFLGAGVLIILLLVFQLGVFVGFRKAQFSFRWGDNYHRAFGGPQGGFLQDFEGKDFINGHGISGMIAKIDANNLIIKDRDGLEKIIIITDSTFIKKGRVDIKLADLKIDDRVVIIGSPKDDGSIEAKIARIFDSNDVPPPPLDFLKFNSWR